MKIAETTIVHTGVELGENANIDHFCLLGVPAGEQNPPTIIGANAKIRSHSVIYAGNTIGEKFQTGHNVLIREHNQIGDNVSVGSHSIVEHHVKIGNGVRIHSQAFVPEFSTLEDECWIGPCVCLTNARYPRSENVKENLKGPHIGRQAKIGAGAVILPGITIGENALIGAGAVVTRNVPDNAVAVGNPAHIINYIDDIDDYKSMLKGDRHE